MFLFKKLKETDSYLSAARKNGRSIGLAPTMGALHKGHVSLVEQSRSENDLTVVSIFVNPAQFNDPQDLKNYPRNLERDLGILLDAGCDIAFVPETETVYPEPDKREFDFGDMDKIMEGRFRPGHFTGVARVVSRLFEIIKPDKAYFGEKDIQQLAIIRKMTEMLNLPVEIRGCPTLREDDGLAMSSRNVLLDAQQRKNAPIINQVLQSAAGKKGVPAGEVKQWVAVTIKKNPLLELEYFEIVDSEDLQPVHDHYPLDDKLIGCIAVRAGRVRLIDNIIFSNFTSS